MRLVKSTATSIAIAGAIIAAPFAMADPNFEVEPVTQSSVPGDLIHNPLAIKWEPEGGNKRVSIVESEGVPGGQAIAFQVKRKNTRKPWDIRMRAPFDASVAAGEEIEVYFWARAAKLPRGQESGKIGVVLGRNVEPHDTVVNQEIMPTADWKMYKVSGVAERDFPTDESDMGFNMGFAKQTIELGPFFAVTRGATAE